MFDAANVHLLECEAVRRRARDSFTQPRQALLQLLLAGAVAQGLQVCFLDGTTNLGHMRENLSAMEQLEEVCASDFESLWKLIGWL